MLALTGAPRVLCVIRLSACYQGTARRRDTSFRGALRFKKRRSDPNGAAQETRIVAETNASLCRSIPQKLAARRFPGLFVGAAQCVEIGGRGFGIVNPGPQQRTAIDQVYR